MKTAAVIAEYNPFHKGHAYQIEETKRQTGADFCLVLMSGDFVQRGAPALYNKYLRTRMALLGGADAVLELPALYALSSAEFFAGGAVTLLDQLGIIDVLSFGSEAGDLAPLLDCAGQLLSPSASYDASLKELLQEGYSYPLARCCVLDDKFSTLLASPNNILGIEYCKSLLARQSSIKPFTLKRSDGGYHKLAADPVSGFASASAIRDALVNQPQDVKNMVPEEIYSLMQLEQLLSCFLTEDDFSLLLHYKLLSARKDGFHAYLDCTPDLSDKICKYLPSFDSFSGFCHQLKSKDLTYARISRVLTHILLDIKTPPHFSLPLPEREFSTPYARLLGFRQSASPLLSAIKKHSSIPLLSKPADVPSLLSENGRQLFEQDLYCASVYESVVFHKFGRLPFHEMKQSPIQIP